MFKRPDKARFISWLRISVAIAIFTGVLIVLAGIESWRQYFSNQQSFPSDQRVGSNPRLLRHQGIKGSEVLVLEQAGLSASARMASATRTRQSQQETKT